MNALCFCVPAHLIQKHGLTDASKTHQQDAFGWPSSSQPAKPNSDILTDVVSSGQFWWAATSSGSIWIANGVHIGSLAKLWKFCNFPKLPIFSRGLIWMD
jgi:hypothetical protein